MFVVKMRNGNTFDFDGMCNRVDYTTSGEVLVFKHIYKDKNTLVLAVIPNASIDYVLNKSDKAKGAKRNDR